LHGPVKSPLDEGEALEVIRQAGAVPSISQLATMLSWERTSTGRVLARWQAAGLVAVEDGPRGRKIIRALTVVQAEHTCAQPGNTQFEPPAPAPAANAVLHDIAHAPSLLAQALRSGAIVRWTFGGMFVALSFVLYAISTILNMTFWSGLDPDMTAKQLLAAGGLAVELINYAIPSGLSFVPLSQRGLRFVVRAVLSVTMILTAIAGASVVKNSLGSSHVSRQENTRARDRLNGVVKSVVEPVSDDAVKDARNRVTTATANRKTTCAPTRTLDIDECNKAKTELTKAQVALASENTTHANAVAKADEQHRKDVADAQTKLDGMSVISLDLDMVAAGVEALVPGVPEAWVTRIVVLLWVLLFAAAPCALLKAGLEVLLAPARTASPLRGGDHD